MRGKLYTIEEKEKAKQLILSNKTYREVRNALGVPKSTLSSWFGKTIKKPITRKAMLRHLAKIRKSSAIVLKNKWARKRKEESKFVKAKVKKELVECPLENISFYKSLLAMLYWTEGSKSERFCGLRFANTDPHLTKLYITLLRKCYNIDETKFSIGLYVHYYHPIRKVKNFWSKTLNIPLTRFNKVYVKKRSKTKKFRKNFVGICSVYYGNSIIRKELLELGLSLEKLVTKNAPIA